MTQTNAAPAARKMLTTRPNASRKLLARKAIEKLASQPTAQSIENSFPMAREAASGLLPSPVEAVTNVPLQPAAEPAEVALAVAPTAPLQVPTWSVEDEKTFKVQAARRKAAGFCARGRDVGAQLITVGTIKPNPDTTLAVIVGLVAERGSIARAELVAAMASVAFPHPKAQPTDARWCQGYVAGAVRNGFLSISDASALSAGEA